MNRQSFGSIGVLARTEIYRCIECGLAYGEPSFCLHGIESGPAYWTDRGLLCSPQCSLAHHRRREAEGTLPLALPSNPFER